MCWQCDEINREIDHYRGLSTRTSDKQSIKSLDILIANLETEKTGLHSPELDVGVTALPR